MTEVLEKNAIPGSWYAKIFRIQTMQRAVTIDFSTKTITKSEKQMLQELFLFFKNPVKTQRLVSNTIFNK